MDSTPEPLDQPNSPTQEEQSPVVIPADVMAELPVNLEVRLGTISLPLGELLAVQPGTILTLGNGAIPPVELLAGGEPIARGELVSVDEQAAVRIVEILKSAASAGS